MRYEIIGNLIRQEDGQFKAEAKIITEKSIDNGYVYFFRKDNKFIPIELVIPKHIDNDGSIWKNLSFSIEKDMKFYQNGGIKTKEVDNE